LLYLATAAASANEGKAEKRDAIVVSGAWSDALHLKGFALIELERFDEAKVALRRAIEIAPLFAPAWNELGAVLQVEKDWPAALAAYTSAAEGANTRANDNPAWKNAQLSRALRGQGYVLVETDRLDEAEALYKRCLEINADDATAKTEIRYIAQLRSKRHVSP
jgi:tetratricopeptide (TPR) repeat protein